MLPGPKSNMFVSFKLPTAYRYDDDAGVHVGCCLPLYILSQGETRADAQRALRSAVLLFLRHMWKRKIFDDLMADMGFVPADHPDADPAGGEIYIGDMPPNFTEAGVMDVPMELIMQESSRAASCPS